jgi:hypothetical protein
MSREALEQALKTAQCGSAETNIIEVIARALAVSEATVMRVLYAGAVIKKHDTADGTSTALQEQWIHGHTLSFDLREAVKLAVSDGVARVRVRSAIENESSMYITPDKLIKEAAQICRGCPISIECVAHNRSDPETCYTQGPPTSNQDLVGKLRRYPFSTAYVRPMSISGNLVTVQCEHPRGTYIVDVTDLIT